jgi:antitoxin CptB
MTGITLSSATLDPRRKRLLFRAWRRGIREMDMIFGGYAEAALPTMDEASLAIFEHLLDAPDKDVYAWITGKDDVPMNYDSAIFRALVAYANTPKSL